MKLKQKIDATAKAIGLADHGLNTNPNSRQLAFPKLEPDGINFLTGLNEESTEILLIADETLRKAKAKEVKTKRELLEKLTGLNLKANSEFWETLELEFIRPQQSEVIMKPENPMDMIKLSAMIAGGYVAPSLEESYNEKYMRARVYVHDEDAFKEKKYRFEEVKEEASFKLYEIKNNADKLFYIAKALGITCDKSMNAKTLYLLLTSYKDTLKNIAQYESFVNTVSKDNKDLQVQQVVIEAMKKKLLFPVAGSLTWGGTPWGGTQEEVIETLKKHEDSFAILKAEVERTQL